MSTYQWKPSKQTYLKQLPKIFDLLPGQGIHIGAGYCNDCDAFHVMVDLEALPFAEAKQKANAISVLLGSKWERCDDDLTMN